MRELFSVKIVEHSAHPAEGPDLVTFQLAYPRFIHAELMTHRAFSRNASSSRAIPVARMIEQVRTAPAMPIHWGKNQPGMQAHEEHNANVLLEELIEHDNPADVPLFTVERGLYSVQEAWKRAASNAADIAEAMAAAGFHKQVVNRLLEPFQIIHVIVTATEWENFFELRDHPDAQPEIRYLAQLMRAALDASTPAHVPDLAANTAQGWHLPYITADERNAPDANPNELAKMSAARCARVSYLNHDGTAPDREKDLALYERLVGGRPLHASPVEHQAYPLPASLRSRNFTGWRQFREWVEAVAWADATKVSPSSP